MLTRLLIAPRPEAVQRGVIEGPQRLSLGLAAGHLELHHPLPPSALRRRPAAPPKLAHQ